LTSGKKRTRFLAKSCGKSRHYQGGRGGATTEALAVNERDIFHAALEITNTTLRNAYLEKVCAGDAALKEHFEGLLELAPNLGDFLEAPALGRIVADDPPLRAGHFELDEELARGGMGIVYRGRDDSLGRNVAVKVLHERYLPDSLVGRRFLDEARITAQLQHPAIPPVFEVGRLANGRPYLAMKLIKGRTLEELLNERSNPAADRGRFLSVFQQVCQAVGYAHSRRILHRDLKTANVMVGAFGEVQVMDWGLAKLVELSSGGATEPAAASETMFGTAVETSRQRDSATHAGSLLGTPAFMSPEQAGGELDRLDERTDVFGLGAILCVILTGQPAYVGKSAEEVRLMAIRGTLADAHARLDQCGADAKLVELCRQCLAVDRDGRPRDAAALAGALAEYLTGAEERARRAEVELAAAETKATERRKRRRVQIALAATVLVILGLVSFGLWWQDRVQSTAAAERAARESRVSAGVAEALHEARERAKEAWSQVDYPDRMQHATEAALAALRRGDDFASDGAPDEISRDLASAHRELQELSRHTRFIQDIYSLAHQYADASTGQDWSEPDRLLDRGMVEALRRFGLDPLHDPVDEVADTIVSSRFRDILLNALWGWRWHIQNNRLDQIIRLACQKSGGIYARCQELHDARDVPGMVAFAVSPEGLSLGRRHTDAIFLDLRGAREFAACRTLLRATAERYPHDEWLRFDLAGICLDMDPPDYAEALCHTAAATLLQPDSAAFRLRLGDCYAGLGSYSQALAAYRKAIELGHGAVVGYLRIGDALAKQKDWDGAIAAMREAVRLRPKEAYARNKLAIFLHNAGRGAEGLQVMMDAIREEPELAEDPRTCFRYNVACFSMNCADGLSGCTPSESERPAYRKQALDFLTIDLAALRKLAAEDPAQARQLTQSWLADKDFASVRDSQAVERLPSKERDAWNDLWAAVRALDDQTAPQDSETSSSN
jgi:serine/threonine protein kinase